MREDDKEKSYKTRGRAAPHNHMVYDKYLSSFGLDGGDFSSLQRRGLTSEQISNAKYASKPINRNQKCIKAIADLRGEKINLEGVPGFYEDDKGHWTQSGIFGIVIPVRDIEENIASLVVRNANPKIKAGKVQNKYVAFSSGGKSKGQQVFQTTHCPNIKGPPREVAGTEIRFTEGVLKADVATALGDIYTVGIQGLKIHDDMELVCEELEASRIRIALDSGEDKNPDIIRAKGQFIQRIIDAGHEPAVEIWDPKYGKGIDDVYAKGNFDKVRLATEEEIEAMLEDAKITDPHNGKWVYCIDAERFINIDDFTSLKKGQFADMFHIAEVRDVNQMLANGFEAVRSKTFAPAENKFIYENGRKCINLWQDPQIKPSRGDLKIFYEHLHYLFPRSEEEKKVKKKFSAEAEIIMDWMAWNVQNPGNRINWALIIKGEEGIGKSAFESIMKRLLGADNVCEVNNDQLHDKYTDFMKAASLIVIHEMMSKGRLDTMNKIKPLLTQDTVQIREMYQATYSQPNRANFLMFTNYDDSIIIDKNDRRYCVLWSAAHMFEGDEEKAYYSKLWDWIRSDGMSAHLTDMLLKRDLSNFNAKGKAPATKSKKDAIKASMGGLEAWMSTCIEQKAWPFNGDVVNVLHLQSVCKNSYANLSPYKWAQALKAVGAVQHDQQIELGNGERPRVWVVRSAHIHLNEENHELGVTAHLRKQYEAHSLDVEPGGNPLKDSAPI